MTKKERYLNLVEIRKNCNKCNDSNLINLSKYKSGKYDLGEISPWALDFIKAKVFVEKIFQIQEK